MDWHRSSRLGQIGWFPDWDESWMVADGPVNLRQVVSDWSDQETHETAGKQV